MPDSTNDILSDSAVRHAHYVERWKNGEVRRVITLLESDVIPPVLARLSSSLDRIAGRGVGYSLRSTKRGVELAASLLSLLNTGFDRVNSSTTETMREFAVTEAQWQWVQFGKAPEQLKIEFNTANVSKIKAIVTTQPMEGKLMRDWFKEVSRRTQTGIVREVNAGLGAGESTDDIVKRIRGTRQNNYSDGVLQTTRREAESVVRTAANHVGTHAREMTYGENNDIIKGVRIVATLDARTTPVCRARDGKVYPPNEGPRPPFHWNCRTTTVPVLKSISELGLTGLKNLSPSTRASMNGQVSESLNYNDWLKRQPKAFQDDVLGPSRGEIFRRGKLTLERFVDDRGRSLTLKELRRLEGLK